MTETEELKEHIKLLEERVRQLELRPIPYPYPVYVPAAQPMPVYYWPQYTIGQPNLYPYGTAICSSVNRP